MAWHHKKTLFPTDAQKDFISFEFGAPDASLLPLNLMKQGIDELSSQESSWSALQYGPIQGDVDYLDSLAQFLSIEYGSAVSKANLCISSGCSQSFWNLLHWFSNRDTLLLLEDPTYFLACEMVKECGLEWRGIESQEGSGFDVAELERILNEYPRTPKCDRGFPYILYLVPTFANPTGYTIPAHDRERLVRLAHEFNMLIICDDVYQLLHFDERPVSRLVQFDLEYCHQNQLQGRVVSNQTFSKILGPGLRLGWIECETQLLELFMKSTLLYSGGSVNHFTSCIVSQLLTNGLLSNHLKQVRQEYRNRCEALCTALRTHLPADCEFVHRNGGYFVWIHTNVDVSSMMAWNREKLRQGAGHRVSGTPGVKFSMKQRFAEYIRLSFAMYSVADLKKGAERLGSLLKDFQSQS
jgi:DNA-binding transcriptional MocR family regulator